LQVVQYIETDDKEFEPTDYDKCNSEEWSSGLYSNNDFACYYDVLKHATCRHLCKKHTRNLLRSCNSGSWCNVIRISNRLCYQLHWIVPTSISLF
jgi:hypothetical protein